MNRGLLLDLVRLLSDERSISEETLVFCASELLLMGVQYLKEQDNIRSLDSDLLKAIIELSMRNFSNEAFGAVVEASFEILNSAELYDELARPQTMLLVLSWVEHAGNMAAESHAGEYSLYLRALPRLS